MFDLTDRVAVVSGGAGLLGKQFSSTLQEAGAVVFILDNDGEQLTRALKIMDKGRIIGLQADVTDPNSVQEAVNQVIGDYQRLDILVNCAAVDPKFDPDQGAGIHTSAFEEYSLDNWNRSLEVNLTGTFLTCQACVKPMLEVGKGVIINLSSIYGLVGPDQRLYQQEGESKQYKPVDYSVTKAGILGLTKYLAAYYAGKNIRVNTLTPGGVFHGHDHEFIRSYSSRAVLNRMAREDELNGALLFLASDASSYMTGTNLVVDGGWTAW